MWIEPRRAGDARGDPFRDASHAVFRAARFVAALGKLGRRTPHEIAEIDNSLAGFRERATGDHIRAGRREPHAQHARHECRSLDDRWAGLDSRETARRAALARPILQEVEWRV